MSERAVATNPTTHPRNTAYDSIVASQKIFPGDQRGPWLQWHSITRFQVRRLNERLLMNARCEADTAFSASLYLWLVRSVFLAAMALITSYRVHSYMCPLITSKAYVRYTKGKDLSRRSCSHGGVESSGVRRSECSAGFSRAVALSRGHLSLAQEAVTKQAIID